MADPSKARRRRFDRTAVVLTGLTLTAVLNTAGCFGGAQDSGTPQPSAQQSEQVQSEAPADVRVGTVSGRLTAAARAKAVRDVGGVALQWFNDAYLVGDYPRAGVGQAFATFTPGARRTAAHDAAMLSNEAIGKRIDAVSATTRKVRLDLLAAHRRVVGATARVQLVFTTQGDLKRTVTILGDLFLTPGAHGGWQVFGYKITRGEK